MAVNNGRLLVSSLVREEQNNLICEFRRVQQNLEEEKERSYNR